MSTNTSNHLVNPAAREAMDKFKMEAAADFRSPIHLKKLLTSPKRRPFTTHTTLYTQHFSTLKQAVMPASCHFSSLYRRYMSSRDFLFELRLQFSILFIYYCIIF